VLRVLLALLLVGIAGCGGDNSSDVVAVPSLPLKATSLDDLSDAVAALKKLGAVIRQDAQGEVVEVLLGGTKITDTGIADLQKALPDCKISR